MEYNDGKRLQTFDEVTTYSYTRSVGCEILMIFKKKNPPNLTLAVFKPCSLLHNISIGSLGWGKANTSMILLNYQNGIDLVKFICISIQVKQNIFL